MPDPAATPKAAWGVAAEVLAAGLGMVVFGLCIHLRPPFVVFFSALGLLTAAAALWRFFASETSPAVVLGLRRPGGRAAAWSGVGAVLGVGLGLLYRLRWGWPLVPRALTVFAPLSALIGATEELLYRGYVQGRVRRWGPVGAVVAAAFLHAFYKLALFSLPLECAGDTDPVFLVVVTFLGGLCFGALRELSGSVAPPLLAHVVFDIIVYGERAAAPWWVWS